MGAMQERIITFHCLYDESLKATSFVEHPGTTMNTAEVLTTALVATDLFGAVLSGVATSWPRTATCLTG